MNIRLILVAIALVFQILSFMKLSGHDYIGIPFVPGPTEQAPANLDTSSPLQLGAIEASEIGSIPAPAGSFVAAKQQGGGPGPISIVAGASPMGSGQAGGGGAASPQSPQAATPGSPDRPASGAATGTSAGGGNNNFGNVVGSPIGTHGGSGDGGGGDSPADAPGGDDGDGGPGDAPSGSGSGGSGGGPQGGPGGSGGIPAGNGGGGGNPIGEPSAGDSGKCLFAGGCESAGGDPGEEEDIGAGSDPDRGEESGDDGGFMPAEPTDGDEAPLSPFEPAPTGPPAL